MAHPCFRILTICALAVGGTLCQGADSQTILFIGNSFTYGAGSESTHHFHPDSVTDLNKSKIGGVPALFKAMADQAGVPYQVSLETKGGVGLDFHLKEKQPLVVKPWDIVCMHGLSVLDGKNPGDPHLLVSTVKEMADLLHAQNGKVKIYLTATWARADQIYPKDGHWHDSDVATMTRDVRKGYDLAAAGSPFISGISPVGESWQRAIDGNLADPNPYDGIAAGRIDLWAADNHHASSAGYYLEALTIFGTVTGRNPTLLGEDDAIAKELGVAPALAANLQRIAAEQVAANGKSGAVLH